jgi:hypothetical protein
MMEPKNVVEMGIAHTQADEKTGGKKEKPPETDITKPRGLGKLVSARNNGHKEAAGNGRIDLNVIRIGRKKY